MNEHSLQFVEEHLKTEFIIVWTCDTEYCQRSIDSHVAKRERISAFRRDIALADAKKNYTSPICSKCKKSTSLKIK